MKQTITITETELRSIINETIHKLFENDVESNSYIVKDYTKNSPEWETYIKPNRRKIWDFINNGYVASGSGEFIGCYDERSLYKNANLIKIAFCGDTWIAVSVYTGYQGGKKCVGITATTDNEYRKIGIEAVRDIIKNDISMYEQFYWTECSGAIEHLYEKYNGIKIPSVFAKEIIGRDIILIEGDEWHYMRQIKDENFVKIIYGFNTQETFDKVKEEYSNYIHSCIQNINDKRINEETETPSFGRYSETDALIRIINIFVNLRIEDGIYELPDDCIAVLKSIVRKLDKIGDKTNEMVLTAIENGQDILETSQPMLLHKF